jgi:hypothetical protein
MKMDKLYIMSFWGDCADPPYSQADVPDEIPHIRVFSSKMDVIKHLQILAEKSLVDEEDDCILVHAIEDTINTRLIWGFWGQHYTSWKSDDFEQGFTFELDDYQTAGECWCETRLHLYGELREQIK